MERSVIVSGREADTRVSVIDIGIARGATPTRADADKQAANNKKKSERWQSGGGHGWEGQEADTVGWMSG